MARGKRIQPIGRREPYSARGISRAKCFKCGEPAAHQWQICSNGNRWLPICRDCDLELNGLVLEFMGFPRIEEMMERYKKKMGAET
jgi:hypothetical protein